MNDDSGTTTNSPELATRIAALSPEKRALLDRQLAMRGRGAPPPLARRTLATDALNLSFAQQRLWLLDRLQPGGTEYNNGFVACLTGVLDIDALRGAVNEIVRRHEVLRARFPMVEGSPVQLIVPELCFPLSPEDLRALPEEERRAAAEQLSQSEMRSPFDLERGPLLRVRVLRLGDVTHWLLVTLHHIVTDGWSAAVLARELSALYAAFCRGLPSPLADLPLQYADYAVWQREFLQGTILDQQLGYWRRTLAGLPMLDLPADRPRPAVTTHRGERIACECSTELTHALKELGLREGTTLFMTLLAAFQVLLCRYSGQEDLAVGVPIAGRTRPELEGLIGFFVNTLVLRGDLSGEPSFRTYLRQARDQALGAYAHQDLPFERLVEDLAPQRDLSRNPLVQVSFNLANLADATLRLDGLKVEPLPDRNDGIKFDLSLRAEEVSGRLRLQFDYSTDLFDRATIERFAEQWQALLQGIVADPGQPVSRLPLMSPGQRRRVLREWSANVRDYPRDACLHALFEAEAARTPDAVAAQFMGQQLAYGELNARSNQLARHLRGLGVGPDVRVAVAMERSLDLVVALLGILKAGGAYVPLDPDHPAPRLRFMLADTQAAALLTQCTLLPSLSGFHESTLCLDTDWGAVAAQPKTNPDYPATATQLAYVTYTSGSTGQPKGVLIEHRGACNHLLGFARSYSVSAHDRVLQTAPIGFDMSLWQLLLPLISGARVVLPEPGAHRSGTDLVALIRRAGVTIARLVPSVLSVVVDAPGFAQCVSLRLVISAGEVLDPELARRFHALSSAQLSNAYGPTETTFATSFWPCRRDESRPRIPVGWPIENASIHVLDSFGDPVPIGNLGELYIGGDGVARGYLDRPDLTTSCFVADPFAATPNARMYRTGDIGRRLPDGSIELRGRHDHQVKVRGVRIELGEIEAVLARQPGVRGAVVVLREDLPGDPQLAAYVGASERGSSAAELRVSLKGILPDYMVPATFVLLPALPLTRNGKVDRNALPAPNRDRVETEHEPPGTPIERALVDAMAEMLKVDRVGVHDNFFHLGGHSLLAVRLINRIREVLNIELSLGQLFEAPTARGLCLAMTPTPTLEAAGRPSVPAA